jgi:hypothetical protein
VTDGSPALAPDRESVGREPDGFTWAQADFPFGDRDNAAPPVRKCLEHAGLVSVPGQPELRFERLPRHRTGDLAARPGQTKRNFMPVRRDVGHQVDHVPDFSRLNSCELLTAWHLSAC